LPAASRAGSLQPTAPRLPTDWPVIGGSARSTLATLRARLPHTGTASAGPGGSRVDDSRFCSCTASTVQS
jgi:hypothetical protein